MWWKKKKLKARSGSRRTEPALGAVDKQNQNNGNSSEVIVIHVIAHPERQYGGYELLQELLAVGLRFGKMSIFHRYRSDSDEILFSLASVAEPGTFDLQNIGSYSCSGLALFMQLNEQKNARDVFGDMFTTAKQLADDLGGILWDDKHRKLDHVSLDRWREKIRCYENSRYSYDLFDD